MPTSCRTTYLKLAVCFLISLSSYAAHASLPVVSIESFKVGNSWTWDYYDPTGKIYSTEQYTVLAVRGSQILIEMASDYEGGQSYKPNHRIELDLARCLAAYKNPVQKKPWSFRMFYLNQGKWQVMDQNNTLAFEEKFNCNGHLFDKPFEAYLTAFDVIDGQQVFSQKLWRKLEASWFPLNGPLQAVAVAKNFVGAPGEVYKMKLRAHHTP